MSGMRGSLDRVLGRGEAEPMWKLKLRAVHERGIAVIDLGKVRNGDFPFAEWCRREADRQAKAEKKESGG